MNLLETTETHYKFAGGVDLPRVTSILSVVHDLSTIPPDVLHHAALRGKAVHRAVWILVGGDPSGLQWNTVHPECLPYLDAFQKFLKETRVVVLDKERLVPSARYRNCGRLDLLVGGLTSLSSSDIPDIKTGVEHDSHDLQVTAYSANYQELTGIRRPPGRWKLYLRNDGTYRLKQPENSHERDLRCFLAIQQTYLWREAHDRRNGQ
jgi:hypothetical protein